MDKKRTRSSKRFSCETLEARQMLAADTGLAFEPQMPPMPVMGPEAPAEVSSTYSVDGSGNNLENPDWGSTHIELQRLTTVEYADGLSDPAGEDRPSAREISNAVADQTTSEVNDRYLTDMVWLWGQFIDHDIDLSESADPAESFPIEVPAGDVDFDPAGTGQVTINLSRTVYEVDGEGVRQQVNVITAYMDGSQVYGSDQETADSLREFSGGRMLTSEGDLLPIGESGFFKAGDIRANENVALTSMHTLWVREHNRLAEEIAAADPSLSDEEIYQAARTIVIAELQAITYNDWLPAILGVDAISDYEGYDPSVNSSIANVFSTAAFRFGHSMLSTELLRLDNTGEVIEAGNISLSDAFFSPGEVIDNGIDSLLLGASSQLAQELDSQVVDDVRNFLFGPPGAGGFDLASLNIQRGRDHGLADYNQIRVDYGLEPVTSFGDITSDPELAGKFESLYGSVDNIDAWVGILAEDHVPGSSMGELGRTIIADQFERIRDGDRLWYQNSLSGETLAMVENTTLADVLMRNTEITGLRDNVFYDDSVFYFAQPAGRVGPDTPALEVVLTVQDDELRLVDSRSGRLLQSQNVANVEKVILVGSRSDDSFRIDPAVTQLGLAGGIVIDGQAAGRDQVLVQGTRAVDTIAVDGAFLEINGMSVQLESIDLLAIQSSPGRDQVSVDAERGLRVVVDGNQQRQGPQRQDRQRPSPQQPNQRQQVHRNDSPRPADGRDLDRLAREMAFGEESRRDDRDGPTRPQPTTVGGQLNGQLGPAVALNLPAARRR